MSTSISGAIVEDQGRIWLRGRTDLGAAKYVQGLMKREGTVEFWGFGRSEIRQMKRVGALIELQGFVVMYLHRPVNRGRLAAATRQFGVRFGPSYSVLRELATRRVG